ncbi:MAG: DUF4278 domain-containing protein [Pleurocapsa sp. MO_226.B13]|nr:DUF4278 domain-containing protein [Pleurocapsa sp. MO_226.B13]
MKLTYRGIKYNQENKNHSRSAVAMSDREIIYRGNSPKAIINPNFPWLKYLQQLLPRPQSKPIFDPVAFWYHYQREYIQDCWHLGQAEKLELAWNLTLQIERVKAFRVKPKTKLKYRGVTYYR